MRALKMLIAVLVGALLLISCGGGSTSSNGKSGGSNASVTVEVSTSPLFTQEPKGANAAPAAQDNGNRVYDPSQMAADIFWGWWSYEAVLPEDWERTSSKVYEDGITVCASLARGAGHDAITKVLERERGYQPAGATAVYAAAVRSLCPGRNFGEITKYQINGYTTYFDKNVAKARAEIVVKVTFNPGTEPTVADVGWLAKYACFYMGRNGVNGLLDYMISNGSHLKNGGLYLANTNNHPQRVIEIGIVEVVKANCFGYSTQLNNEAWTS